MSDGGGERSGLEVLRDACASPWVVASRWREAGGRVVGLVGASAPRELVLAAGMLPIRVNPERLRGDDATEGVAAESRERFADELAGLEGELPAPQLAVVAALLAGDLDWIDGLLIGRDTEAHTKLFYVLREMAADPGFGPLIPWFGFSDTLRLPTRTSAVYNRRQLRILQLTIAHWGQVADSAAALHAAIATEVALGGSLRQLEHLCAENRLSGQELFIARAGARVLPPEEAMAALRAAASEAEARHVAPERTRVFLTGSEPNVEVYEIIEAAGLHVVGDDHGDDLAEPDGTGSDTIDWLADRYQFSMVGAARAGLDRVASTVARAQSVEADVVVQLLAPTDVASEWELTELRELLPGTPVLTARMEPGAEDGSLRQLVSELAGGAEGAVAPTVVGEASDV